MVFPSRFFLFLLSTGLIFGFSLVFFAGGAILFVFPPILGYIFTALVSHTTSQRKRMDALEKEVAELKEKIETLKPTEISEGK